ncbi:DUF4973 domain-containing protein [Sphingobacterium puteale]|uniref:DUF4973 domain-containing protein n=1 Tax=Sphingobacterium puteale TaxID=2420510 RepID=A0A420VVN2_9SPHI|nr:DUF4973 domain-containing protein [Sphingobacterium puteale]RKO70440.1 DUF4973 domain-containing protein [Sphingobacterium puteale]
MSKPYIKFLLLTILAVCGSCNDEWKEEQFEHYVSFKAPLESEGVTNIYVRYKDGQKTAFMQPLEVSGSTTNDKNLSVKVGVDTDTLGILNYERFQTRTDFYYKQLNISYFTMPQTVNIKSGENTGLMAIDFSLRGIDMTEKWVLPLTILDDPGGLYKVNPRKHYKKALLRINPFNNYSGTYSGTALKVVMEGHENETPIVKSQIKSYVVDENTIFFYAGNIDEERKDRKNYKVFATFNETGGVTFRAENPEMKFAVKKDASYTITEQMDAVRPYLLHRYITINNVDYEFTDYTLVSTTAIKFKVSGSLILERQLNTQIPDEDQSIEW